MFRYHMTLDEYGVGDYLREFITQGSDPCGSVTTDGDGYKVVRTDLKPCGRMDLRRKLSPVWESGGVINWRETFGMDNPVSTPFTIYPTFLDNQAGKAACHIRCVSNTLYLYIYDNYGGTGTPLQTYTLGEVDGNIHQLDLRLYTDKVVCYYDEVLKGEYTIPEADRVTTFDGLILSQGGGIYTRYRVIQAVPVDIFAAITEPTFLVDGLPVVGATVYVWDSSQVPITKQTGTDGFIDMTDLQDDDYYLGIIDPVSGYRAFGAYTKVTP